MSEEFEIIWQAMKGAHYQRTIDNLALAIRQTADLEEALQIAMDAVARAVHAEAGTLWIYDRNGDGKIHPRAVCGGNSLADISLLPGEGIAGQVIEKAESVIIKNCQADPRWAGRVDKKTGFTTQSMICVPLILDNSGFGSVQIINNKNGQLFDEKDLLFAEQLAFEIVKLLDEKGLLKDYSSGKKVKEKVDYSFRSLIMESSPRELEAKLYSFPEFAALTYSKQQEVLQLAGKLRECFVKPRG